MLDSLTAKQVVKLALSHGPGKFGVAAYGVVADKNLWHGGLPRALGYLGSHLLIAIGGYLNKRIAFVGKQMNGGSAIATELPCINSNFCHRLLGSLADKGQILNLAG